MTAATAFASSFEGERARLRGLAYRMLGSMADADDVVQEALVRIHRGVAGVRDHDRMSAWIYQVARSAIADHGRRRRPVAMELDEDGVGDEVATLASEPDDAAFSALARCVRPFVGMLASPYREAIAMVELEGCSQVAAAARLGVPLSTLKSRVQRGRAQLRQLLETCCAIELDARSHVVDLVPRPRPVCGARCDRVSS